MGKILKIFVADGCDPCKEIKDLAEKGKMLTNVDPDTDIELIDVTTDEGFPEVEKEQLSGVPTAKYDGQTCKLHIDEETKTLIIDCTQEKPNTDLPSSPKSESSLPEAVVDNTPSSS